MSTTQLVSKVLGEMRQVDFPNWWRGRGLKAAYFGGIELPTTFMDLHPEQDPAFLCEADQALEHFSAQDLACRSRATALVMANCREFLEAIGEDEELEKLSSDEDIWSWVTPQQIYLTRRSRRDRAIYLQVSCHCRWEDEHGLQFVFRQGRDLVRVSSEDGHLTDSDAYDFPDQEDALLWSVLQSK